MSRPWMPLYISDFLADTGHLTAPEVGAYMLLIMHYWQKGGLPDDERLIARIARLSAAEWQESRDVLAMLFKDGWRHKRIDAELAKAEEIINKRKAAGSLRGSKSSANADHVRSADAASADTRAGTPFTSNLQKEEPTGSSKKRACRLPDNFVPDLAVATAEGLTEADAQREAAKFADYFRGAPGQKGVKADWPATWRNWCRKAADDRRGQPPRSTAPPRGREDPFKALAEIRDARDEHSLRNANRQDAQRLPAVDGERQGPVVDLQRGAGGYS